MKSLFENFAVFLVGILSLALVYLIVQYNLIKDTTLNEIVPFVSPSATIVKKKKAEDYLNVLEGYEDKNIEVDAEEEHIINSVQVEIEEGDDELSSIVDDITKESYMENLSNYNENNRTEDEKKRVFDKSDPEKLEFDEIEDKVGTKIDNLLSDL